MARDIYKTVTFDNAFRYSKNGQFEETNCITVCEPGYEHRQIFHTMRAYMGEAEKGLMKIISDLRSSQPAAPVAVPVEEAPPADAAEAEAKKAKEQEIEDATYLEQMRMVLGIEGFPKFCDYVQKVLTNHKGLAYCGGEHGQEIKERVPVTDGVWEQIANAGGVEEMDRVIAAFLNFFAGSPSKTTGQTETATNGSTSSSTPAESRPARSRSARQ